jgi:hypothetical protein
MIVFIDSRQSCVEIICYGNLVDLFLETNLSFGILPISVELTLFQGGQDPRLAPPLKITIILVIIIKIKSSHKIMFYLFRYCWTATRRTAGLC